MSTSWDSFKKSLQGYVPVIITESKLQRLRQQEFIEGQNVERKWWDMERGEGVFSKGNEIRKGFHGPFSQFDDFYLAHEGNQSIELGISGKSGDKSKLTRLLEAVTGGWVTTRDQNTVGRSISRVWTQEQLWAFQEAAWIKATMDPRGQSIVNNIQFYTIGNGLAVDTPDAEINKVIKAFREMNDMPIREKNIVKESFIEGEYFFLFFIDKNTGDIRVRKISPADITDIETHPEDKETRLTYHRETTLFGGRDENLDVWYPDINYYNQGFDAQVSKQVSQLSDDKLIMFMKYGYQDEIRGRVPMASILRFMKYYEDFIIDRIRLHHERAKVVWIRTIQGSGRDVSADNRSNPLLAPKGGTMWTETPNIRYRIEAAKLDSSDAEKDGLLILYSIAAGVTQPIHILEQRADQAVYASLRASDSPFSQMIESNQDFHRIYQEKMYKLLIREKVEAGKLPEKTKIEKVDDDVTEGVMHRINEMVVDGKEIGEIVKEAENLLKNKKKTELIETINVEMSITFPDVIKENPLDNAKVLLIHQRLGIVSKRTMAEKSGYNWKNELRQMKKEAIDPVNPQDNLDPNQPGGIKDKNDDLEKGADKGAKPSDIDRSVRRSGSGRLDNELR